PFRCRAGSASTSPCRSPWTRSRRPPRWRPPAHPRSHVWCRESCNAVTTRARRPERLEDSRADEILPRHSRRARHDLAGGRVHHVLVHKPVADRIGRREESHPPEDFLARKVVARPEKISVAEPGVVREEVFHGELARLERAGEHELGKPFGYRIVPRNLVRVHEHRE